MHAIASVSRHASRACTRLSGVVSTPMRSAAPMAMAMPTMARANSTLPIMEEYVRRSYPFPTVLESDLPADYSKWLYYHHQFPHDTPIFKSKLTVDIRDLGLDPTSRMVLREIVAGRYNRRTHTISFISRNLPTAKANENRVFQQLDACLLEAREIAKQMNAEGAYGRNNGAAHNRLLKPVPIEANVRKQLLAERREKVNQLRVAAGLEPLKAPKQKAPKADVKPAAEGAAAAAVPAAAEKPRATRFAKDAALLEMTPDQTEQARATRHLEQTQQ